MTLRMYVGREVKKGGTKRFIPVNVPPQSRLDDIVAVGNLGVRFYPESHIHRPPDSIEVSEGLINYILEVPNYTPM